MNQLNLNEVHEYAEKHISVFHQKRLEYITTTTELDKILQQKNPEKDGYYKICGQEFWHLVSGSESFYIDIIEPIGHKAKQKNEEFLEAYSVILNKFTLKFAQRFCMDGKIDWKKLLEFNSGTKKKHK
ncbi:MAG: hypothetical protein HS132_17870 [Planctomycetia bacterium]|nr:hypothetical protein [Planctomycetia bacterium]